MPEGQISSGFDKYAPLKPQAKSMQWVVTNGDLFEEKVETDGQGKKSSRA